ncbi:NADPH-dependent 7-cyano-7-deazaguanine reductase QueF [Pseudaeromonas sharmana]|uniref:NADPH-dependent 7-cyano-7-deazaguanine reductase n=1 Tax=Pseudaeromonas sharmana TaxID=328412 RepID=A0ABV8CRR6_9GAMM
MAQPAGYEHNPLLASLSLGKQSAYVSHYTPALLQAVPRSLNRNELKLDAPLPFTGADLWTLYELSWLDSRGKPVVAIGEVSVPANSNNLIESKSFKLYLNSLNQTRFDDFTAVQTVLQHDLSRCAEGDVHVNLYRLQEFPVIITDYEGLCLDEQDLDVECYDFDASLLNNATDTTATPVEECLHSHLLKSNCLVTGQPDWGSVCIHYQGHPINHEALLRYLISFRNHNEFHEQCVERIFMDLMRYCEPEKLTVYARYTRRGGLDINPFRSNWQTRLPSMRLIRQ